MLTDDPKDILDARWKNANMAEYPVVEVLWLDASSLGGEHWIGVSDLIDFKPAKSLSVGYLVEDRKNYITLLGMVNDSTVGHALTLPKGMIKEIRYLG